MKHRSPDNRSLKLILRQLSSVDPFKAAGPRYPILPSKKKLCNGKYSQVVINTEGPYNSVVKTFMLGRQYRNDLLDMTRLFKTTFTPLPLCRGVSASTMVSMSVSSFNKSSPCSVTVGSPWVYSTRTSSWELVGISTSTGKICQQLTIF